MFARPSGRFDRPSAFQRSRSGGGHSLRSLGQQMIAVPKPSWVVARSTALEWFPRQDAPRSTRQVILRAAARIRLGRRYESSMRMRMVARTSNDDVIAPAECITTGKTEAPGRRPNHRVEVNRHQPLCLPTRSGHLMARLHSNVHGQVAVTHPGRSAKSMQHLELRFAAIPHIQSRWRHHDFRLSIE